MTTSHWLKKKNKKNKKKINSVLWPIRIFVAFKFTNLGRKDKAWLVNMDPACKKNHGIFWVRIQRSFSKTLFVFFSLSTV